MTVTRNVNFHESPQPTTAGDLIPLGDAHTVTIFGAEFLLTPIDGGYKIKHRGTRKTIHTIQGDQFDAVEWIERNF